jgi:AraC-like DNA-binding protein
LSEIDFLEKYMLLNFICAGYCEVPRPWLTTAKEGVNRLYYIHSGKGGYTVGGQRHEFREGMLYLLPSFPGAVTWTDEDCRIVHSYANFELVPPIISREVLTLDPKENPLTESVTNTFLLLSHDAKQRRLTMSDEEKQLLISSIEYLIRRAVKVCNCAMLDDETVNRALTVMNRRMSEGITIEEIAKECFMSTDGFIRKFTRVLGVTPYAYYKNLKLRTAKALRASGETLERAADICGYSDSSALLHAMKNDKAR